MSTSILRPNGDVPGRSGSWIRSLAGALWVPLAAASSSTTDYVTATAGMPQGVHWYAAELNGETISLGNRRIRAIRIRADIQNPGDVGRTVQCRTSLRDPVTINNITTPEYPKSSTAGSIIPWSGAWHATNPDGREWTASNLQRLQVEFYSYRSTGGYFLRLHRIFVDVDMKDQPVTGSISFANTNTTRPIVTGVFTAAEGDPLTRTQLKIFTSAQTAATGFDPDTAAAVYDSGVQATVSMSLAVGRDLAPGVTYRAYLRGAYNMNAIPFWSEWASATFSLSIEPASAPTLGVTADTALRRAVLAYQAQVNIIDSNDADAEGTVGSWIARTNANTPTRSTAQARHGTASIAMTATAAGAYSIRTSSRYAVLGGQQISGNAYMRPGTTGRASRIGFLYWKADGTASSVRASDAGATVVDAVGAWTVLPTLTAVVPSDATTMDVYVEVTPAGVVAGEVHYVDQVQVVPGGTVPAWSPGGYLETTTARIDAWDRSDGKDNLARLELSATRAGIYSNNAPDTLATDPTSPFAGADAMAWVPANTASQIDFGFKLGDFDEAFALPGAGGVLAVASFYVQPSAAGSYVVDIDCYDGVGGTIATGQGSKTIALTTARQRVDTSAVLPAGTVHCKVSLLNNTGLTGQTVLVSAFQWELRAAGSSTVPNPWVPGQGTAPDWQPVRGMSATAFVTPAQHFGLSDFEPPPGIVRTYRGLVDTTLPGLTTTLASTPTAASMGAIWLAPTGTWWLKDPYYPERNTQVRVTGFAESIDPDVALFHPSGLELPVPFWDSVGGENASGTITTLGDAEWARVRPLLMNGSTILLDLPEGGHRYYAITRAGAPRAGPLGAIQRVVSIDAIEVGPPPDLPAYSGLGFVSVTVPAVPTVAVTTAAGTTSSGGTATLAGTQAAVGLTVGSRYTTASGGSVNMTTSGGTTTGGANTTVVNGGGGFQNCGCVAPLGVGHSWKLMSGGDVAFTHVTNDGITWRPSNLGLEFGQQRICAIAGSKTVANRIWAFASASATGTGAGDGRVLRGTYNTTTGQVSWTQIATLLGAVGGGSVHPRQVGKLIELDEANGYIYIGNRDGIHRVDIATGNVVQRAMNGCHVTSLVLDPDNPQIMWATAGSTHGGTLPGVYRIANVRSGTVVEDRYATLTNPQDISLVDTGTNRYLYCAAMTQGPRRWLVSNDITTGWTDISAGYNNGGNGCAKITGRNTNNTLSGIFVIAFNAGENSMTNAGAYSLNGGGAWQNENVAWTTNFVPRGETEEWWLAVAKPSLMLPGGNYDCSTPVIDPANTDHIYCFGRSGVWWSGTAGTSWRPCVRGMAATVGWLCRVSPTFPGGVYLGDGDWTLIRTTDRFLSMPEMMQPSTGSGQGLNYRADTGRFYAALGDTQSNSRGAVQSSGNPFAAVPTWREEGWSGTNGDVPCTGVCAGDNASGQEVVLTVRNVGIQRVVGGGAVTTVEPNVSTAGNPTPRLEWPNGHLQRQYVYCSASNGLWRSTDHGANWSNWIPWTNSREYPGRLCWDPSDLTVLYVTKDDGTNAGTGLFKITGANTASPTMTKIGPDMTDPGPCAIHPTTRQVYVACTASEAGGPRLYRSPGANPGAATIFDDISDLNWRAGVLYPHDMDVDEQGNVYVSNKQGGHMKYSPGATAPPPAGGVIFALGDQDHAEETQALYTANTADPVIRGIQHWYTDRAQIGSWPGTSLGDGWGAGWINPADTSWSTHYGKGECAQPIVWLADVDAYAVDPQFYNIDLPYFLQNIPMGHGPNYGEMYVVLYTEFQNTQDDGLPRYDYRLRMAYLNAISRIRAISLPSGAKIRVGLGFAGYAWIGQTPDLSFWEPCISASDFTCVQHMQDSANYLSGSADINDYIRRSVSQLGGYGLPVMISHFELWGGGATGDQAWTKFVNDCLNNDAWMNARRADGLFFWGFMQEPNINNTANQPTWDNAVAGMRRHRALNTAFTQWRAEPAAPTTPPSIDATNSPAAVRSGATQSVRTTASFTPPAGSLVVALVANNTQAGIQRTHTVTDSKGGMWVQRVVGGDNSGTDAPGVRSQVEIWVRKQAGDGTAMTVTDTLDATEGGALIVKVLTSANVANPIGDVLNASGINSAAAATATTVSPHSLVIGLVAEWNVTAVGTPGTGCTVSDGAAGPNITSYVLRRSAETAAAGTAAALTTTAPASGTEWNLVAAEFKGV